MDQQGGADDEGVLGQHLWTLAAGVACGLVAGMLARRFPASSSSSRLSLRDAVSTSNKMALVVRTDLGMGRGKACAQCAHAAVACYSQARSEAPALLRQWELFGQKKVALKAPGGEGELRELWTAAREAGLVARVVRDAGETQLDAGTATVLGVGPGPDAVVDKVTGHLKLF